MSPAAGLRIALVLLSAWLQPPADDERLALAELPAYREALEGRTPGPAAPATFRDLWDRPDDYRGRRVRVEGTVRRRFRQGPVGAFPALTEVWAATPAGDLFCLVHPASAGALPGQAPEPPEGSKVRFSGTFLKRIRYRGGDVDRLAPLVVGPDPPEAVAAPDGRGGFGFGGGDGDWSGLDWAIGLVVGLGAALILARAHLRRPPPPPPDPGPPPEFLG